MQQTIEQLLWHCSALSLSLISHEIRIVSLWYFIPHLTSLSEVKTKNYFYFYSKYEPLFISLIFYKDSIKRAGHTPLSLPPNLLWQVCSDCMKTLNQYRIECTSINSFIRYELSSARFNSLFNSIMCAICFAYYINMLKHKIAFKCIYNAYVCFCINMWSNKTLID